jgi:hypothetical protein
VRRAIPALAEVSISLDDMLVMSSAMGKLLRLRASSSDVGAAAIWPSAGASSLDLVTDKL